MGERVSGLPAEGPGSVATVGQRVRASTVDLALLSAGWWLSGARPDVLAVLVLVDQVLLPWRYGVTVGKLAFGLRMLAVDEDGRALTEQRGLTLLTAFGRVIPMVGCPIYWWVWLVTLDRDARSWPDRFTRIVVVTAR